MQLTLNVENFVIPIIDDSVLQDVFTTVMHDFHQSNDQYTDLLDKLQNNKVDRRMLVAVWNPIDNYKDKCCQLQFYVANDTLSVKVYQRIDQEKDLIKLDCARYILLLHLICHVTQMKPKAMIVTFGLCNNKSFDFPDNIWSKLVIRSNEACLKDFSRENLSLIQPDSLCSDLKNFGKCYNTIDQHEEEQYLSLTRDIIKDGFLRGDRTGVGIKSLFGPELSFTLSDNTLPLLTTKRVFHRAIIEELLWFIRGSTDSFELSRKNVHIWDANGSKEFLIKTGLGHREEGDLGPVYGFQWRHYGASYVDKHTDYTGKGFDQLSRLIRKLREGKEEGDNVIISWNSKDLPLMALPPCHCLFQFILNNSTNELSCKMYQRAGDMGLGVPFNIASYAIFTHMMAHLLNMKADKFHYALGDAHVYLNHEEILKETQLKDRHPRPFPKLKFKRSGNEIKELWNFQIEDFEVTDYNPYPKIQLPFAL